MCYLGVISNLHKYIDEYGLLFDLVYVAAS